MATNPFLRQLSEFYKAARHLWGRCPRCGDLFRLSDAAISYGNEPPRDWLRRLEKQQNDMDSKRMDLDQWQVETQQRERELSEREKYVLQRERGLEAEARTRAHEMLKDKDAIKGLLKDARQDAVRRSRSTLLGGLFERLGPFLQRFGHDPRDVRPIMNPIDYVCFDGLTIDRSVERITFVEVKSGTSKQTAAQKSIMEAVREGRVATEVWQFGARGVPIEQQLIKPPEARRALPRGGQ